MLSVDEIKLLICIGTQAELTQINGENETQKTNYNIQNTKYMMWHLD